MVKSVLSARGVQRRTQVSERPPSPDHSREECGKIFLLLIIFIVVRARGRERSTGTSHGHSSVSIPRGKN